MTEPTVESGMESGMESGADSGVVRMPIDAGLGHVEVSESGELTALELDERVMRTMRADRLAEHIVTALACAQDEVVEQGRDAFLRQLRRDQEVSAVSPALPDPRGQVDD